MIRYAALLVLALIPVGAHADQLQIQASFFPYYEFTRNVAGTAAGVSQFLPLGAEAHDWEPSISKVLSLSDSDVFVYNGLGMEAYVDQLVGSDDSDIIFVKATDGLVLLDLESTDAALAGILEEYQEGHIDAAKAVDDIRAILDEDKIRIILEGYKAGQMSTAEAVYNIQNLARYPAGGIHDIFDQIRNGQTAISDGLEELHGAVSGGDQHDEELHGAVSGGDQHDEELHGVFDPHVWLDPVLAIQQVNNIRDALLAADPANAAEYTGNAATYASELDLLHAEYAESLSACRKDTIVTFHSAFSYLVERYGLEAVSITGLSPTDGVSTADLVEITRYVQDSGVGYILVEEIVDTRTADVIAEETGTALLILSTIEGVSQEDIAAGKTYLDKMRDNLETLKIALECNAAG